MGTPYYRLLAPAAFAALASTSSGASANAEPAAAYDSRSVALGGTGVAYIHNASSIYHNPATLEGIGTLALTAGVTLSRPGTKSPLNGPGTSVSAEGSFFPLFLVGGAYRITKFLVAGIAVFPTAGFGSTYKGIPSPAGPVDLKQSVMTLETTPSLSLALTEGVSLGVGYRITYAAQSAEQLVPPQMQKMTADMSGWSFSAFHFGLYTRPAKYTRLGLSYRNKFTTHMSGTVNMGGMEFDAETDFSMPHLLKAGIAQGFLDGRLTLVGEVKRGLYAAVGREMTMTIKTPMGDQVQSSPIGWRNTWAAAFGAEYRFPGDWAARLGYSATQSFTSDDKPNYFMTAPGTLHGLHAGAGLALKHFDIDVGGFYAFGGKDVTPPPTWMANAGTYKTTMIGVGASITYRL